MQTFWAIVTCFQATYNEQFFSNASIVSEFFSSIRYVYTLWFYCGMWFDLGIWIKELQKYKKVNRVMVVWNAINV